MTRNDLFALLSRNQLANMTLVSFLTTLSAFLARRRLAFRLGVGMFGARRERGIAWCELADFRLQLINAVKQCQKRGFHRGCHFCFQFRRYPAHAGIGTENAKPSP